jgi:enoyl-[acyl-carrier protein] reductase II
MCATECTIHPSVKDAVLKAKDRDTVVTGYSTGHPVRVIKNKLSREIEKLDRNNQPDEIEALGTGKLALAMRQGDTSMGSLMAGQSAAMVCRIEPAATIVQDLVSGAESAMRAIAAVPSA